MALTNLTKGTVVGSEGGSATTNLAQGLAKAWVGAEADAVRSDAFNMSSSTDHGDGDFSYGLVSAFSSLHYAQSGLVEHQAPGGKMLSHNQARHSTSILAVRVFNTSDTVQNYDHDIVAHGDLA
jgi:hypothetical protein